MRILVLALCTLSCSAAASRSHAQPAPTRAPTVRPPDVETIAFTISGGISLGSYKAGVNWMLVEANKRLANDSMRTRIRALAPQGTPEPLPVWLGAVAGASAGNINAIASSILWCRRLPNEQTPGPTSSADSAESSLLWRLWIPTGLAQLEARHAARVAPADAALLVRDFFQDSLLERLGEAMRDHRLRPGCRVPVGVTLTSIAHDTLGTGSIVAPVQRHSVLAEFRVRDASAAFHIAPAELRSAAMGSVIYPTPVRDSAIGTDAIFGIIKASAAFPIAFAPVEVRYYRYRDLLRPGSSCPPGPESPCQKPRVGMFSDGGVFDNLPISLTVELMRRNVGDATDARLRVMPIDPQSTSESGPTGRPGASHAEPRAGLGAVGRLLLNAVPSARAYELQLFTRSLDSPRARTAPIGERAAPSDSSILRVAGACPERTGAHLCVTEAELRIAGSSRTFPLMGERMNAFGAFIGRPLRQYDFYLGVFDGLRQFARAGVCRRPPPAQASTTDAAPSITACETAVVRNALLTNVLHEQLGLTMSPIGWTVLRLAARSAGILGPNEGSVPPDSAFTGDERVVYELSRIRDAGQATPMRRACARRHPVDAILCDRDYIGMLRALDAAISPSAGNTRGVDPLLLEAIDDPERFVDSLYTRMLWRLDRVERWLGGREDRDGEGAEPRTPSSERLVALLEAYYLSGNERYRTGFEALPSSIPPADRNALTSLPRVMPYYFGAGILMDAVVFGYRPTWYLRKESSGYTNSGTRWGVLFPAVDALRLDTRRSGGRVRGVAWHAGIGIGAVMLRARTSVSAIEIVPSFTTGSAGGQASAADRLGIDLAARLAGNKFRLSLRRQPQYLWKPPGPRSIRSVIGVIAVNDVPGIAYWTYRLLRAH